MGEAAPDQHQPEGADHRRALPRQRRPPAGGQGEGDGRHRLAQGRGEVQEGDRHLHRQAGRRGRLVQLPHPGRLLRVGDHGRERGMGHDWGPQPAKDDEFTEANHEPRRRARTWPRRSRARRTRSCWSPTSSRPASTSRCSRRCTSTRSSPASPPCRRSPGSTAPTAPPAGSRRRKTFVIDFVNKPEDIRTAFEPYFTNATLETETDPYVVVHLADQARPGRDLHRGAGAPGRRAVGRAQGQQRALGRDQPGQARLRAAATPPRSRPTTRSPSTPSTCSARTSPPTSGSTTS